MSNFSTMVSLVSDTASRYPDFTAYEYLGFKRTYSAFMRDVARCAAAFARLGVKSGERVVVSLPNCPQTVTALYALNALGAFGVYTHPLSAPDEMAFYIKSSRAVAIITLYQFYGELRDVLNAANLRSVILTAPGDMLPRPIAAAMRLREKMPPSGDKFLHWRDFYNTREQYEIRDRQGAESDCAVVLFSGGTSGKPKGILLTNANFNALAYGTVKACGGIKPGDRMLAVMPIFHGFSMGICLHTALYFGGTVMLVPRFTPKSYAKLLHKGKPSYIAAVPTLFEALLRLPDTEKYDFSSLRGVFSGGDVLTPDLKRRTDAYLHARGAKVGVREGYGLTESVTACCLTPPENDPEQAPVGSVGKPYDGMNIKIVAPETTDELQRGETGEICVSGAQVMPGYDGDEEETASALRIHADGRVWLHTGDLGSMDESGWLFFRGRLKRLIKTSGYNVYPIQVEGVLCAHEFVAQACVAGVPDDYRMTRVKAFIVPAPGAPKGGALIDALKEHCRKSLSPQSRPREYAVLDAFPRTKLGKTDVEALLAINN